MAALEDLTKVDWLVLGILLISTVGSFIRAVKLDCSSPATGPKA